MNFDFPAPSHVSQLRALWHQAFGDEDDFLDSFFYLSFPEFYNFCYIKNSYNNFLPTAAGALSGRAR